MSNVISQLKEDYRLIVVTKGDLLDQERKLQRSNIAHHFHHVEIVHQKEKSNYTKLLRHLDINPNEFLMVGNSLKSDILPVLRIGANAIHIPYATTWQHEEAVHTPGEDADYLTLSSIAELPFALKQ